MGVTYQNINTPRADAGFSLFELLIAMTVMLVLLGMVSALLGESLTTRSMETQKADALSSAHAALNLMSREIGNSGFGLKESEERWSNGIVINDSNLQRIHFRSNLDNSDRQLNVAGEDIVYFYDDSTGSIARYDPNAEPETSILVNGVSNVVFKYFDFSNNGTPSPDGSPTPTANTAIVRITVTVKLQQMAGQPKNQTITFTSDISIRNSDYMLRQQ